MRFWPTERLLDRCKSMRSRPHSILQCTLCRHHRHLSLPSLIYCLITVILCIVQYTVSGNTLMVCAFWDVGCTNISPFYGGCSFYQNGQCTYGYAYSWPAAPTAFATVRTTTTRDFSSPRPDAYSLCVVGFCRSGGFLKLDALGRSQKPTITRLAPATASGPTAGWCVHPLSRTHAHTLQL